MDRRSLPDDVLLGEVAAALHEGREVVIAPAGDSMLPFIRGGADRVVLRRREDAVPGDIVLVRIGERYILHRIIARDGERLTLMGDGNLRKTEHCPVSAVLGTAIRIIRPDGSGRPVGKARLWRLLRPLRRPLLAIYKRIV